LNILTKISIVVLVVLSLFVSAVFITQASIVPNYKVLYDAEKTKSEMNEMHANNNQIALQRSQQDVTLLKDQLDKALGSANTQKQKFDTELLAKSGELEQAKREIKDKESTLDLLAVAVKSASERLGTAMKDLEASRKKSDELAESSRQLTQQYQETSARLEREIRLSEHFRGMIADLQKQMKEMAEPRPAVGVGSADASGGHLASATEDRYKGTITSVKGDLAQINIGSVSGVKKGDKLYVYRDAKFLAYLKIETVDPNSAAGIITERTADITQGDSVTNRLTQ